MFSGSKRLSGGSAYADALSANAGYAGGKGPVWGNLPEIPWENVPCGGQYPA